MKKQIVLFIFSLMLSCICATAQTKKKISGKIYKIAEVDKAPEFKGNLEKYLKWRVAYPKDVKTETNETVKVRFVVTKTGETSSPEVIKQERNLDVCVWTSSETSSPEVIKPASASSFNQPALKVINEMPLWSAGELKGKAVNVYYELDINFKKYRPDEIPDLIDPLEYKRDLIAKISQEKGPYTEVEEMPTFPGGEAGLAKFIKENLRYPVTAAENRIEGRIMVGFVISEEGDIGEIKILRAIHDNACDKEAIRLVKLMPRWKPGKHKGVAVPVSYVMPIRFSLSDLK